MSGSGNDFILIDSRNGELKVGNLIDFVQILCARQGSVGADGLIIIEKSACADFRWRFFNADGARWRCAAMAAAAPPLCLPQENCPGADVL